MEPITNTVITAANEKSRKLRELVRAPEILIMPGAYDVLSALLFEQMDRPREALKHMAEYRRLVG